VKTSEVGEPIARHVSNAVTAVMLRYARIVGGEPAVATLLEMSGESRTVEELEDAAGWSSQTQTAALWAGLCELSGDPDVGLAVGAELLKQHAGTEVAALLRSLGSPAEVLRNIAATSAKYSTMARGTALEVGVSDALIEYTSVEGFPRHRQMCNYTKGALTQVSPLFGLPPATVIEVQCELDGADSCLYRVSWEAPGDGIVDLEQKLAVAEGELAALTTRFEALQETATVLVSSGGVDDALETITRRAGVAVRAPRFLLAVRLTESEPPRIHSVGFDAGDAAELASALFDGELIGHDDSCLTVAVGTGSRHYGWLVAALPDGAAFLTHEHRLLEAYAAYAAAALDSAAALEVSQRRDRTARALLELAKSLNEAMSEAEACQRTARAVVAATGCDRSRVWIFEPGSVRLAAIDGFGVNEIGKLAGASDYLLHDEPGAILRVPLAEAQFARTMMADPKPLFVSVDTASPDMRRLFQITGEVATAAVPIVSHEGVVGIVGASVLSGPERLREDDDLVERLSGIADHAAIALANARLVDQVRHQAMHDDLTGLPNTRLLEDRVGQEVRAAERDCTRFGLLFLDLDHFKPVNDRLGHQQGDELLVQVANRLRQSVRAGDTVARIGGDEFCVLLRQVTDREAAVLVGSNLVERLREPFVLGRDTVAIAASVGVALFPDDGDSFASLLKLADLAMYRAKAGGRGRVR
jgi:diguanylate cyclase (GGDEF)-like protein